MKNLKTFQVLTLVATFVSGGAVAAAAAEATAPLTTGLWVQHAYLKAPDTKGASSPFPPFFAGGDGFGTSAAISGDTVVVGAPSEDSNAKGVDGDPMDNSAPESGAAYVFVRNGSTWIQQAYLKASNAQGGQLGFSDGDRFGWSVAISGDTVVVGAPNEASSATGVNGDETDNSAPYAGAAYVFVRSGSTWSQQAYLKGSNTDKLDELGWSVAISGDTVVVGARHEGSSGGPGSGAAYVYVRSGSTWVQQAYLKASNTRPIREFATSVAISGDTVVVGDPIEDSGATGVDGDQDDHSATSAGAAYVFVRNGSTWTQQSYLKASNTEAYDSFGYSVAISGDTAVVGSFEEDSGATGVNGDQTDNSARQSGAAYIFARSGSTWSQQAYLKASSTEEYDRFFRVAVSGDTVVVGAREEDSNATGLNGDPMNNLARDSGAAYVFVRSGSTWSQQAYLKASNTDENDGFGSGVGISGDTVIVAAWGESSSATGVNGDQTNNSIPAAGAAYVYSQVAQVSFEEIPALGLPGLTVLLLALATAGLLVLRRRSGQSRPGS